MHLAALDAAAGQPHREAVGLWSRPSPFSDIGVRPNSPPQITSVLSSRPRAFQVRSRPAIGLSMTGTARPWFCSILRVRVPLAAGPVIELHEAHAALDQPPGQQAIAAEGGRLLVVEAVESLRRLGLLGQVHGFRRLGLHAEGQFVAGDAGVEFGLLRPGLRHVRG